MIGVTVDSVVDDRDLLGREAYLVDQVVFELLGDANDLVAEPGHEAMRQTQLPAVGRVKSTLVGMNIDGHSRQPSRKATVAVDAAVGVDYVHLLVFEQPGEP